MSELTQMHCVPCEKGTPPLTADEVQRLAANISGWDVTEEILTRGFRFRNFREAMAFVNRVADLAEEEGHHPDIHISWNRVRLELTTHAIKGLSENDFIMAAKVNELAPQP